MTQSKPEVLFERLRQDILGLSLAPDTPLRLPALSDRYGVGVTPVRECLHRLVIEKLVVPEHNRGFRAAPLHLAEMFDLERARNVVEGALFTDAIRAGNDAWETGIVGSFHLLSKTEFPNAQSSDVALDNWNRRHGAFHDALINGAPSETLNGFRSTLNDRLGRYLLFVHRGLAEIAKTDPKNAKLAGGVMSTAMELGSHQELYQVAMDRDEAAAMQAFSNHSNLSVKAFEQLIDMLPPEAVLVTTLVGNAEEAAL